MNRLIKICFIFGFTFMGIYLSCAYPFASCQINKLSRNSMTCCPFEVDEFLRNGANVDVRDRNGDTALIRSIRTGNHTVVQILLENAADVNLRAKTTETPLIMASRTGDVEIVKMLLSFGADVNARDEHGRTALIAAVISLHPAITDLLINGGANMNVRDDDGKTALAIAAEKGDKTLVDILSKERQSSLSSVTPEDLPLLGTDFMN